MTEHEFTIQFNVPLEADPDDLVERLGEAGCTDATIGTGLPGRLALDFSREGESLDDARKSAIQNVFKALRGIKPVTLYDEPVPSDQDAQDILRSHARSTMRITEMVNVADEFKLLVHTIGSFFCGNHRVGLFLYSFAQLSELGTGWDSCFEHGNAQSQRRDDVTMGFITAMCGCCIDMRLIGRNLTWSGSNQNAQYSISLSQNRGEMIAQLDAIFAKWWHS